MKVVIIEDEKLAADHLSDLIKKYDGTIEILTRLESVKKKCGMVQYKSTA